MAKRKAMHGVKEACEESMNEMSDYSKQDQLCVIEVNGEQQ